MNYAYIFVALALISCKDNKAIKQPGRSQKDTVGVRNAFPSLEVSSVASTKETQIVFSGLPGFLTRNFDDTSHITKLQRYVINIDKQKLIDSVTLGSNELADIVEDKPIRLTGYFQNGKLVKMVEWFASAQRERKIAFYLKNDKLAFVRETDNQYYVDKAGIDSSKFGQIFRGEYYFDDHKFFDEVSLGHNRFEIDENDAQTEYLKDARLNRASILYHLRTTY